MIGIGNKAGVLLAGFGVAVLAGCGAPGDGSSLGDKLLYGGVSAPPVVTRAQLDDVYCPPAEVATGGAVIQSGGGQVAISQLARECTGSMDGSTTVKVGVEGRALLGAGGGAGRYNVPVSIVVKRGSTVFASRVRQVSVAIPAGDTQGSFTVVEEGLVVPSGSATDFEIEVSLGARAAAARRRG